jgi:hypothetical protein
MAQLQAWVGGLIADWHQRYRFDALGLSQAERGG